MAYETTSVAVEKSQADLRALLTKYGASSFTFGESIDVDNVRWVGVEFTHDGHLVRLVAPLRRPNEKDIAAKVRRARTRTREDFEREHYDQEARRIWRVLYWSLKARMVAIEDEVETFEEAFLAHMVDPATDRTLWQTIKPAVDAGHLRRGGPGLAALGQGRRAGGDEDVVDAEVIE